MRLPTQWMATMTSLPTLAIQWILRLRYQEMLPTTENQELTLPFLHDQGLLLRVLRFPVVPFTLTAVIQQMLWFLQYLRGRFMHKIALEMEVLAVAKDWHRASAFKNFQPCLQAKATSGALVNMDLLVLMGLLEVCTQRWNQEINPLRVVTITAVVALTTIMEEDMVRTKKATSTDILDLSLLTLLLGVQLHLEALTTNKVDHKTITVLTEDATIHLTVV
mmetsp:Transcript_17927/g.44325  ORF Transcript_17927/g.44325 Transcript_17927/m.44325 type:complete len:220 (+) Transcript_17927:1302-1961(+)